MALVPQGSEDFSNMEDSNRMSLKIHNKKIILVAASK